LIVHTETVLLWLCHYAELQINFDFDKVNIKLPQTDSVTGSLTR